MSNVPPSPYATPKPATPSSGASTSKIIIIVLSVLFGVMLLCGGVLVALLLPAVQAARQAARSMSSQNNMKMIGLGLHNYHSTYNKLPAAYTTDSNGKPLLSWRVAILPFVEEQMLFQQFDFSEPWDSPTNLALSKQMPSVYNSPVYGSEGSDQTNYMAIRTPQSAFPGDSAIGLRDILDGTSNTLFMVELPNKSVVWSSPDDSDPADFYAAFGKSPLGVSVLFADGATARLASDTAQQDLDAYITRNGAETVSRP